MATDWASILTQPSPYAQTPFSNLGPYSVAAPNTQGLFVNNGGNLGPGAQAFLRSDMRFGLSNTASDFTPQAIAEFLAAAQSGQVAVNPGLPPQLQQQAQQILQQLQTGSIAPQQLAAFSPSVDANQTYNPGGLLTALNGTTPSATGGGTTSTGGSGGAGGAAAPIDYSGAASYGGITSQVFGAIPGTPEGTMPTVQLRQLLEQSLEADRQAQLARDQFNFQMSLGNQQLALQAKTQADDLALRARQLDQQAAQFSQTFGLQTQEQQFRQQLATQQLAEQTRQFNVGATGMINGAPTEQAREFNEQQRLQQAGLLGSLDGQETLQGRQQRLAEEQAYQQLAAHPENLIQAALAQASRTPGGIPVTPGMTTPVDANGNPLPNAPGALGASATEQGQAAMAGRLGGVGNAAPAFQSQGPEGLAGQQAASPQVPLPAIINALLQRQAVPGYGPVAAQGQMVSFADLQNNPALRLNPGALDLASLGNLGQTEQGYLASILGAQGQDVGSFTDAVKRARAGQSSSALVPSF
jgi:hypothetical protein